MVEGPYTKPPVLAGVVMPMLALLAIVAVVPAVLPNRPVGLKPRSAEIRESNGVGEPVSARAASKPLAELGELSTGSNRLRLRRSVVGHSVQGAPIHQIVMGSGDYRVLLIGSIHGNEAQGTPLLRRLVRVLESQPQLLDGATVICLPCVNPDGVADGTRGNAQGVDLNRNFPAANRQNSKRFGLQALSEPEALAIHRVISRTLPDQIVTLHEPLECVDYDGPAFELAAAMSRECPLPVKKLGSRPGSLGSFAGVTLGIPTITFELPRDAKNQSPDHLWELYGSALVTAVRFRFPNAAVSGRN